jgi:hypothetical protein
MRCPLNKDRRGKECIHNIKGNCTGFNTYNMCGDKGEKKCQKN